MFFAGRLPRPPWETRKRVEAMVKRIDRLHIRTPAPIQVQYAAGAIHVVRGPVGSRAAFARRGPAWSLRAAAPGGREAGSEAARRTRVVHVAAFRDPLKEMDKLHELYDNARRDATPGWARTRFRSTSSPSW